MALIGYARVSTTDQTTALQIDALKAAGCQRIFEDELSGSTTQRPGLAECLNYVREGDTLVVWKLDRLGRSLQHLLEVVNGLHAREIGFTSLTESINTTTNGGRLIFSIFGALAEFERGVIRERVSAGLVAARKRGVIGGRPTVVTDTKKRSIEVLEKQGVTTAEICSSLGISRSTYFRSKRKTQSATQLKTG